MRTKIRIEQNKDGIGGIEEIIAGMPDDEQAEFQKELEMRLKNEKWCIEHHIEYIPGGIGPEHSDNGIAIRDTFDEIYCAPKDVQK